MKYGVQGIPTMLFVSDGKVVHTQVGALPEAPLKGFSWQVSGRMFAVTN